jgi:type IV pilus assembly protein PilV
MLTLKLPVRGGQQGTTMIELLITLLILAFGLLGLAVLQTKVQVASTEAYQRAQAIVMLTDISQRIKILHDSTISSYVTTALGTGDSQPDDCTTVTAGPARDLCEWSQALKGAAEVKSGSNVGGMTGARGCITRMSAPTTVAGVCTPGSYLVEVAWQGLQKTAAPPAALVCGKDDYGDERLRRAASVMITIACD